MEGKSSTFWAMVLGLATIVCLTPVAFVLLVTALGRYSAGQTPPTPVPPTQTLAPATQTPIPSAPMPGAVSTLTTIVTMTAIDTPDLQATLLADIPAALPSPSPTPSEPLSPSPSPVPSLSSTPSPSALPSPSATRSATVTPDYEATLLAGVPAPVATASATGAAATETSTPDVDATLLASFPTQAAATPTAIFTDTPVPQPLSVQPTGGVLTSGPQPITLRADAVYLRAGPGLEYPAEGLLLANESHLTALSVEPNHQWVQVRDDLGRVGWASGELLLPAGIVNNLPIQEFTPPGSARAPG